MGLTPPPPPKMKALVGKRLTPGRIRILPTDGLGYEMKCWLLPGLQLAGSPCCLALPDANSFNIHQLASQPIFSLSVFPVSLCVSFCNVIHAYHMHVYVCMYICTYIFILDINFLSGV